MHSYTWRIPGRIALLLVLAAVSSCARKPQVTPKIYGFTASDTSVIAGNPTTLTAYFSGGTGTVDQGVGPIQSGKPLQVIPKDKDTRYTLTVVSGGLDAKAVTGLNVIPGASLQVSLTGQVPPLPLVAIVEPGNPATVISRTTTLKGLPAGSYQVVAVPKVEGGVRYDPTITGSPVNLPAGGVAPVQVDWEPTDTPPSISPIPDQAIALTFMKPRVIDFTIADGEDPASALTVTATADDPKFLPASALRLGGSGADRTLTIKAMAPLGRSEVTVAVTDTAGNTTTAHFMVTQVQGLVRNLDDSGTGSLRELLEGNSEMSIGFAPGVHGTIHLTSGPIVVRANLKVYGPGADQVRVDGGGQGAILKVSSGGLVIHGLAFTHGSPAVEVTPLGHFEATDCAFTDNQADAGGAIFDQGTATVTRSLFQGNVADCGAGCASGGGAVRVETVGNPASFTVTDSTFTGNVAKSVGGASGSAIEVQGGAVNIRDCTLAGNLCQGVGCVGGALSAKVVTGASVTQTNVTLAGDIIAGNTGGATADVLVESGVVVSDQGYDVLGPVSGYTPPVTAFRNVVDPHLSSLGGHGGPMPTIVPLPESQARFLVPLTVVGGDGLDQRGQVRRAVRQVGRSDAGAVDRLPTDPTG